MTGRDAPPLLDEQAVERLLTRRTGSADPHLEQALALVRTLGDGPAPPPTAALADLMDRGFQPTVVPFRRPSGRRRWAARTGATLAATAASLVVAGTAAALPPGLQDTVADVVSALTPFELPRPESGAREPDPVGSVPVGEAPRSQVVPPSVDPTPSPPPVMVPADAATGDSPATGRTDGTSEGPSTPEPAEPYRGQPTPERATTADEPAQPAEKPAGTPVTVPQQPAGSAEQQPRSTSRP